MRSQPTGTRDDDAADTAGGESSPRPTYPEHGGIDVLDSLLIRQPIAEGRTQAVRDLLADSHPGCQRPAGGLGGRQR